MHELLLFGQVPSSRHDQVLKILAGIAAMQPQQIAARHLLFKPTRPSSARANQNSSSTGVQSSQAQALQAQMQGDLFYMQLVGDVKENYQKTVPASDIATEISGITNLGDRVDTDSSQQPTSNGNSHYKMAQSDPTLPQQNWSLEFRDLPEVPGRRPVTSRLMASVNITDGDPIIFMDALGYK